MHSILLQIDEEMARQLEAVAPAKTRSRARFIRLAIQKALMDLTEVSTRAAYERHPQQSSSNDAASWAEWSPLVRRKRRAR